MRILRPVVEVSAWSVINTDKPLTPGGGTAPKRVGPDHAQRTVRTIEEPPENAARSIATAPALNIDAL
jgi:hypothetical protein